MCQTLLIWGLIMPKKVDVFEAEKFAFSTWKTTCGLWKFGCTIQGMALKSRESYPTQMEACHRGRRWLEHVWRSQRMPLGEE